MDLSRGVGTRLMCPNSVLISEKRPPLDGYQGLDKALLYHDVMSEMEKMDNLNDINFPIALTIKGQNVGASTKNCCKQMLNFDKLDRIVKKVFWVI